MLPRGDVRDAQDSFCLVFSLLGNQSFLELAYIPFAVLMLLFRFSGAPCLILLIR